MTLEEGVEDMICEIEGVGRRSTTAFGGNSRVAYSSQLRRHVILQEVMSIPVYDF